MFRHVGFFYQDIFQLQRIRCRFKQEHFIDILILFYNRFALKFLFMKSLSLYKSNLIQKQCRDDCFRSLPALFLQRFFDNVLFYFIYHFSFIINKLESFRYITQTLWRFIFLIGNTLATRLQRRRGLRLKIYLQRIVIIFENCKLLSANPGAGDMLIQITLELSITELLIHSVNRRPSLQ